MVGIGSGEGGQVMTAMKNEYGLNRLDENPFMLNLWRLRDSGHAIYDGEECGVSGNWVTCEECALLSANIG